MKKVIVFFVLALFFSAAASAQTIKGKQNLSVQEMQEFKTLYQEPAKTSQSFIAETPRENIPLEIVDEPICYPSPFSASRDKEIKIQYVLTQSADIDIYIFAMNGEIIKRISAPSGSEGGLAELNKVAWDGKSDAGYTIGNGIYLGTIIERTTNKVLSRFTLAAYN